MRLRTRTSLLHLHISTGTGPEQLDREGGVGKIGLRNFVCGKPQQGDHFVVVQQRRRGGPGGAQRQKNRTQPKRPLAQPERADERVGQRAPDCGSEQQNALWSCAALAVWGNCRRSSEVGNRSAARSIEIDRHDGAHRDPRSLRRLYRRERRGPTPGGFGRSENHTENLPAAPLRGKKSTKGRAAFGGFDIDRVESSTTSWSS